MLSPLQLDDFALEHLTVSRGRSPSGKQTRPEEIAYDLTVDYAVRRLPRIQRRPRYSVSLSLRMQTQDEDVPAPVCALLAATSGTFSFAVGTPSSLLQQLVPTNCLAILYGILRGIVI